MAHAHKLFATFAKTERYQALVPLRDSLELVHRRHGEDAREYLIRPKKSIFVQSSKGKV